MTTNHDLGKTQAYDSRLSYVWDCVEISCETPDKTEAKYFSICSPFILIPEEMLLFCPTQGFRPSKGVTHCLSSLWF